MVTLEEINALLNSGEVKTYPQHTKPVILGNWKAVCSEERLKDLFVELGNIPYYSGHPVYLALPEELIKPFSDEAVKLGHVIGTTTMNSVVPGSFTEDIAVKLVQQSGARFVLLDACEVSLTVSDPYEDINGKLQVLLSNQIFTFVALGEHYEEFIEGELFTALQKNLEKVLKGISGEQFENLAFVYASTWISAEGLEGLKENLEKSYHVFRHILSTVVGNESSTKIKVLVESPHIIGSVLPYLKNASFEGVSFSNLALETREFLQTCQEIASTDPDFLYTEVIIPHSRKEALGGE